MPSKPPETYVAEDGQTRVRGVSFSIPVVIGSVAFWLGKKATESASHRWTVYLRTPDGSDISHVLKGVRFGLHSSFADPIRTVSFPPYELSETGWGEFEVAVSLVFRDDAGLPPLELYHRLALYEASGTNSTKRPVVSESREEIVLWEPTVALHARLADAQGGPRADAPASHLEQFFTPLSTDAEYRKIQAARQRVAQVTAATLAQLGEGGK